MNWTVHQMDDFGCHCRNCGASLEDILDNVAPRCPNSDNSLVIAIGFTLMVLVIWALLP